MKQLVLVLFFFGFFIPYSEGQTIHDDKKVTKREERFVNRKTDGERKLRLKRWRDNRKQRKLKAKSRAQRRRDGNFFTRLFNGNKKKKNNWDGKDGWFARQHGNREKPFQ